MDGGESLLSNAVWTVVEELPDPRSVLCMCCKVKSEALDFLTCVVIHLFAYILLPVPDCQAAFTHPRTANPRSRAFAS
jgi:hypothetical protein